VAYFMMWGGGKLGTSENSWSAGKFCPCSTFCGKNIR